MDREYIDFDGKRWFGIQCTVRIKAASKTFIRTKEYTDKNFLGNELFHEADRNGSSLSDYTAG